MKKQLGKIGTVRREIRGKACPFCGGYRYQLLVHSSTPSEEESNALARCIQCNRPRQFDDGFWKNLVDIKIPSQKDMLAKPLAMWQSYRTRKEEIRKTLEMLAISGAVRPGNVEFRYVSSPEEGGILSRSFAVASPSDADAPPLFQTLYKRLSAQVGQWVQRLHLQEVSAQLHSRSLQILHWFRRGIIERFYFSRV